MSNRHDRRVAKASARNALDKRSCGECDACCTVMAVIDMQPPKLRHERCAHLNADGVEARCGIYSERPTTCREWKCAWLASLPGFTGAMRPDRIGLLAWLEETAVGTTICFEEVWPGAFDTPLAREALRHWTDRVATLPVLIFGKGDLRRLIIRKQEIGVVHDSAAFGGADARERGK